MILAANKSFCLLLSLNCNSHLTKKQLLRATKPVFSVNTRAFSDKSDKITIYMGHKRDYSGDISDYLGDNFDYSGSFLIFIPSNFKCIFFSV